MNTQYRKNLKDAMTACKNYTDKKIDDLRWELGSHTLDVSSDTDVAFSKSVPANTIGCQINKIGGMSYKSINIWDEQWEVGEINGTTGANANTGNYIRSKNYINALPNTQYYCKTTQSVYIYEYDSNKNYIRAIFSATNNTFTTSSNCAYIRFATTNGGTTYLNDICINVSNSSINGNYYPYFEGIRDSAVTSVVSKGANLLKLVADTSGTVAGVRYNISNGVVTLNGTSTSTEGFWISLNTTVTAGKYYFEIFNALNQGNSTFIRLDNAGTSAVALVRGTSTGTRLTLSEGEFKAFFWIGSSGITFNNLIIYPMLVSGSTAPSEFIAYEGTIATTTIPSEVQSLTGYGWGINENCYNYIDYEAKKFIKKVGRVDLGSLNWSYSTTFFWRANLNVANRGNAICSTYVCSTNRPDQLEVGELSTYWVYIDNVARIIVNNGSDTTKPSGILIYELAEPVETDISEYIDDNSIEVEPNGTLTFNNTYEQAVPSDIDYLIEEVKA